MSITDIIKADTARDQQFLSERIEELRAMVDIQTFCTYAIDTVTALLTSNKQECDVLEAELARQKKDLEAAAREHFRATTELASENRAIANYEAELRGQESRIRDLVVEINRQNSEIEGHRRRIQEEKHRRENAVMDLIPFHGIISAIITGDAKRAIPFYSQIDGIISAIERNLEAAVDRLRRTEEDKCSLQNQAGVIQRQIQESYAKIAILQEQSTRAQATIVECDRKTKAIGQQLTQLQNIRVDLSVLREKYRRTLQDVALAGEMDEPSLINECLEDFRQLLISRNKMLSKL